VEAVLLDDPRVPRSGRVLLAAAGGGRELQILLERGYEVFAFNPSDRSSKAREALASQRAPERSWFKRAIRTWRRKPRANQDRSTAWLAASISCFGWGSLSHLTEPGAVLETLAPYGLWP